MNGLLLAANSPFDIYSKFKDDEEGLEEVIGVFDLA